MDFWTSPIWYFFKIGPDIISCWCCCCCCCYCWTDCCWDECCWPAVIRSSCWDWWCCCYWEETSVVSTRYNTATISITRSSVPSMLQQSYYYSSSCHSRLSSFPLGLSLHHHIVSESSHLLECFSKEPCHNWTSLSCLFTQYFTIIISSRCLNRLRIN